jgi:hypothetical protein
MEFSLKAYVILLLSINHGCKTFLTLNETIGQKSARLFLTLNMTSNKDEA